MLIANDQIRLTAKERHQLCSLTGSSADNIKTTTHLKNFVEAHLVSYPGRSPEERLLRKMLQSFST